MCNLFPDLAKGRTDRISPRRLKGKAILVEVVTVKTKWDKSERKKHTQYSKIKRLIELCWYCQTIPLQTALFRTSPNLPSPTPSGPPLPQMPWKLNAAGVYEIRIVSVFTPVWNEIMDTLHSPTATEFREQRLRYGVSQSRVARMLSVHKNTVKNWEHGRARCSPATWAYLCIRLEKERQRVLRILEELCRKLKSRVSRNE